MRDVNKVYSCTETQHGIHGSCSGVQTNPGSLNKMRCAQKFTRTHHGHECHGKLEAFSDIFELFFSQGGTTVQHASLMAFRNEN